MARTKLVDSKSTNLLAEKLPKTCYQPRRLKEVPHYGPDTVVLHNICHYQKSTYLLICKVSFQRLAREVLQDLNRPGGSGGFSVILFEDVTLCAVHARRVTIMSKDMNLALCTTSREKSHLMFG
eukprot:CCRYP_001082-RA/>CCRYP_001082-RA protein AED:0.07 eAED:0.07 QI:0/0/0/1/0/0/2/0/123